MPRPTKTANDYRAVATARGIRWIGESLPANNKIKTAWECGEGHVWEATYNNVSRRSGCPYCAGVATLTAASYKELAQKHGWQWISDSVPTNRRTLTFWKCQKGHAFERSYDQVNLLKHCPQCGRPRSISTQNGL